MGMDELFRTAIAKASRVVKADRRRQVAYSVVLEPRTEDDPDTQGDWYDADSILEAAHAFMAKVAKGRGGADVQHDGRSLGVVVESWIAPADGRLGDQVIKAGAWIAGIHYPDAAVWARVEAGELGAFSVGGTGHRIR